MPYSRSLNFFISTICITATKNFVYKNIIDSRAANNTHKGDGEQSLKTHNAKNKKPKKEEKKYVPVWDEVAAADSFNRNKLTSRLALWA